MSDNHALIFGASGISGWAIVNAILNGYPDEGVFQSVTALTNRPLKTEKAQWPSSQKLQVVSGLDLLTEKGQEGLEEEMKLKIKGIDIVTHVYYFAYIMDPVASEEVSINTKLFHRAITAVDKLSNNLKFVVLPTGTKVYGIQLLDKWPYSPPLVESLPLLPEPYASEMFYNALIAQLKMLSVGKSWTWCEIIPDNIIGFVPNNNIYCLAQTLALYLSLYASVEGPSAECAFPGTEQSWKNLSNESNQDTVAKFAIYASLHPGITGGGRFNTADNARPSSWSKKWPVVCEYFGLKGIPPPAGGSGPQPVQYIERHMLEWKALEKKHELQPGYAGPNTQVAAGFQHFIMTLLNFDRQMDTTKCHEAWGKSTIQLSEKDSWWQTFDRFRKARVIP